MLNALFGVAYELETPFFPQLAAPNVAPKTELYRTCTEHFMSSTRKAEFHFGAKDFEPPTSLSRTSKSKIPKPSSWRHLRDLERPKGPLKFTTIRNQAA